MSKRFHTSSGQTGDSFSDFFRNASQKEKIEVFTKAARKANSDQRKLVRKADLKLRNG